MVHVAWPLVGLGIRFAQDKGLHRRRGKQKHTAEDESAKRVFWSVVRFHFCIALTPHQGFDLYRSLDVCFPWSTLCNARRRVSLQQIFNVLLPNYSLRSFDLDYPIECDDEFWNTSDPEQAFKQPPGKPCKVSCFIWSIKLAELLGFALRTLYATRKSKMLIGLIGNEWESQVVAELDSSMNKWKDTLPHFRKTFAFEIQFLC